MARAGHRAEAARTRLACRQDPEPAGEGGAPHKGAERMEKAVRTHVGTFKHNDGVQQAAGRVLPQLPGLHGRCAAAVDPPVRPVLTAPMQAGASCIRVRWPDACAEAAEALLARMQTVQKPACSGNWQPALSEILLPPCMPCCNCYMQLGKLSRRLHVTGAA